MDLGLKGKVAVVTGGSRGLGEAVVSSFASEGANVVIGDVNLDVTQKLAEKLTNEAVRVLAVKTDVTRKADAENLAATALKEFGRIDILVNNAGVVKPFMFLDIEEEEWDRVLDVNAKGVYLVSKAILPHMIAARNGKIVNIASVAGKQGYEGECNYVASKFAVVGITQTLAKEMAKHNINVNAVCPGIIHTFMWDTLIDFFTNLMEIPKGETFDETFQTLCDRLIPLKRAQLPQDIANAVLFLSSEVSRNMTGQAVNVCGGMRMD